MHSKATPPSPAEAEQVLLPRLFGSPTTGLALPYRLYVPNSSAGRPWRLLLSLHGAGERGTDNRAQLGNNALAWVGDDLQADLPTVVLYPQCPPGMQWVDAPWAAGRYALAETPASKPMAVALELLAWARASFPVDQDRILVTGLSMGGYGTWDIILRNPTLFAGAIPLCGGGDPSQAATIRDVPVWAFHGERDPAVPVAGSRAMIEALRFAGGTPRYTEIAECGHDIWTHAYLDRDVLRWLLSRKRGQQTV